MSEDKNYEIKRLRDKIDFLCTAAETTSAALKFSQKTEDLLRQRAERAEAEVEWIRTVLAEEMGYSGPLTEASCPLREKLAECEALRKRVDKLLIPWYCNNPNCDRYGP